MSAAPEPAESVQRVVHVTFYDDAPADEVERVEDAITCAAFDAERGEWDPFIHSHAGECSADPHHMSAITPEMLDDARAEARRQEELRHRHYENAILWRDRARAAEAEIAQAGAVALESAADGIEIAVIQRLVRDYQLDHAETAKVALEGAVAWLRNRAAASREQKP